jgi:hypothetical protein
MSDLSSSSLIDLEDETLSLGYQSRLVLFGRTDGDSRRVPSRGGGEEKWASG